MSEPLILLTKILKIVDYQKQKSRKKLMFLEGNSRANFNNVNENKKN